MDKLTLEYDGRVVGQDIDLKRLRPEKSYDYLIENRNSVLSEILGDKTRLEQFLQKRDCPCCNNRSHHFLFEKDNLNIVQCDECQVSYVNPIFKEEKYLEVYQSDHYQKIVKKLGEDSHDYRRERFGKERVDFFEKYLRSDLPKTFLEIGCSTGFVIEEAQKRGWKASGIELNPSAASFGKSRGLKIYSKPLQEISFDEQFSAIGLFDVLEHLVNPGEILKEVYKLLPAGGGVFIYVPNFNSATKEILGVENSHFIWPTHHLTYFTPETLRVFLEKNGFEVFFWETQGLDLYDIDWFLNEKTDFDTQFLEMHMETLQFFINKSGYGKNLRMFARKI